MSADLSGDYPPENLVASKSAIVGYGARRVRKVPFRQGDHARFLTPAGHQA